jgi:hypothetical protein
MRPSPFVFSFVLAVSGCVASRSGTEAEPSAETSSGRTPKQSLLAALALFDGSGRVAPKILIAELERFRGKVASPERELVERTLPLVRRYDAAPESIGALDLRNAADVMAKLAAAYPRDFELQLATAAGIHRIESTGGEDGSPRVETDSASRSNTVRAEALVASFPGEARAFAHLARVLSSDGTKALPAMRAYVKCAELDPRQKACLSGFQALADDWLKPRCAAFKESGFGTHAAYEKPAKTLKKITVAGRTLYMESKPALTGAHVQDVTETPLEGGGTHASGQARATHTLQISLTPLGAGRFADLTRAVADKSGYLAVRIGKELVAAPRVMSTIDSGLLVLGSDKPLPWRDMCVRFETRRLPPDLAKRRG